MKGVGKTEPGKTVKPGKTESKTVNTGKTVKTCESGKILNPPTGRCVSKSGAIGKRLLSGPGVSARAIFSPPRIKGTRKVTPRKVTPRKVTTGKVTKLPTTEVGPTVKPALNQTAFTSKALFDKLDNQMQEAGEIQNYEHWCYTSDPIPDIVKSRILSHKENQRDSAIFRALVQKRKVDGTLWQWFCKTEYQGGIKLLETIAARLRVDNANQGRREKCALIATALEKRKQEVDRRYPIWHDSTPLVIRTDAKSKGKLGYLAAAIKLLRRMFSEGDLRRMKSDGVVLVFIDQTEQVSVDIVGSPIAWGGLTLNLMDILVYVKCFNDIKLFTVILAHEMGHATHFTLLTLQEKLVVKECYDRLKKRFPIDNSYAFTNPLELFAVSTENYLFQRAANTGSSSPNFSIQDLKKSELFPILQRIYGSKSRKLR